MANITIDPEVLLALSDKTFARRDEIKSIVSEIEQIVQDFAGNWAGASEEAYVEIIEGYRQKIDQFCYGVDDIANGLKKIANSFLEADESQRY